MRELSWEEYIQKSIEFKHFNENQQRVGTLPLESDNIVCVKT